MPARTALEHTPDELTYHGTSGEIAVFSSASASRPGHRNHTYRDVTTGAAYCECRAAEAGRDCWHLAWVATAAVMVAVAPFVGTLDGPALCAAGRTARQRLDAGTFTTTDLAVLHACRAEYRRRKAAPAPVALPIALPVAA